MHVPVDMVISVDVLSIHYNADFWGPQDPQELYPMRFSPEFKRNPVAYLPFGLGPKNCIGTFVLETFLIF